MGYGWNPAAIPGLIALVTGVAMAVLVFWTRPDRSQNRRLALLLFAEGVLIGFALTSLALATTRQTASAGFAIQLLGMLLLPWIYLGFLATLDTPLVAPLKGRIATWGMVAAAVLAGATSVVFRDLYVVDIVPDAAIGGFDWLRGPLGDLPFTALLASSLFGLVVAISVYRRTPASSPRRPTAGAYLAAFGIRDLLQVASLLYILLPSPGGGTPLGVLMSFWLPQIATILFVLLLAYGILRTQLFEIDLKLKWTLEKGTVAAVFVAVFFVASEGAQIIFADFAGSEMLGVLAAGALVFVLSPLQRLAEKVGDAAMPGVEDTEAYRQTRKEEIYRAQLEELMADEQITKKERRALHRLQDDLGLDADAVNRLERDVLGTGGGGTG